MDKLRAIEYFLCAASEGSLGAAAKRLDVSVPAVSKMLASLERELGVRLFERGPAGLTLTPAGVEYAEACAPALARLVEADAAASRARTQATGPVALAVQHLLLAHCVVPSLSQFHARHPGIQLDVRDYVHGGDEGTDSADLRLAMVWDDTPDEVARVLAATRMVVCASPRYWARHGVPTRPADLARHTCFALRAVRGTLMDHWPFERSGERESVVVRGWLSTSNTHRDAVVAAVLAGEGVMRSVDLAIEDHLREGRLVPVMTDWDAIDSPKVRLTYRPAAGRLPRVRATIDFLAEVFRDIERRCSDLVGRRPQVGAPPWAGSKRFRRASTAAEAEGRKRAAER